MQQSLQQLPTGYQTPAFTLRDVPWQIWVVIAMLSLEGLGNLLIIPSLPIAAFWLICKIFYVVGFIRRWRVAFVLFCIVAGLHVFYFAGIAPFVAFLNLVILVLALTQFRLYFPPRLPDRLSPVDMAA